MTRDYFDYKLGEYKDKIYFLSARVEPDFDDPDDFAVIVFYNDPDIDTNVEIARIDNAHGYVHFDKLYRRDQPKEELDVNVWEAVEMLEDNWRTYARSFEKKE
ncbi:MAG: hypothetical protein SV377_02365 [Halobacteria archaeon]|nr:hypothetical protein [Halobacteria archaeon]